MYLGANAFQACSSLSQVTLVNGLKLLSSQMFYMVDGKANPVNSTLKAITVPSTITSIGWFKKNIFFILKFYSTYCRNQILILYLGDSAFRACSSLSDITLVNGLTVIGTNMFYMTDGYGFPVHTSLVSIIIPSTLTTIGWKEYLFTFRVSFRIIWLIFLWSTFVLIHHVIHFAEVFLFSHLIKIDVYCWPSNIIMIR